MILNLLGGLFGRSDAKQTERKALDAHYEAQTRNAHYVMEANAQAMRSAAALRDNPVNLARMVSDSESSGFNPLTVLRAGALSAYGMNQAESYRLEQPTIFQTSAAPTTHVPSVGSVVVNAAQQTLSGLMQSGALSARPAATMPSSAFGSGLTYAQTLLGGNRSGSAFQMAGGLAAGALGSRAAAPVETGDRTNTPPTRWFDNDPDSIDVGVAEEAAGDIGGTAFFPLWLSDQVYYNTTGMRGSVRDVIAGSAFQLVAQQYKSIFGGMVGAMQSKPSLSRLERIRANPNHNFGEPRDGY